MERKAATPKGLASYLRSCRSGLLGDESEAAQDSPPGKRPPVVEYAITLYFYCRLYTPKTMHGCCVVVPKLGIYFGDENGLAYFFITCH